MKPIRGFDPESADGTRSKKKPAGSESVEAVLTRLTNKFARAVRKAGLAHGPTTRWPAMFRQLFKVYPQYSQKQVEEVVDWYCEALVARKPNLPRYYTARMLFNNFERIERLFRAANLGSFKITPIARRIGDKLFSELSWNGASKDMVLAFVQETIRAYRDFAIRYFLVIDKLNAGHELHSPKIRKSGHVWTQEEYKTQDLLLRFATHLQEHIMIGGEPFVFFWARTFIQPSIVNWQGWNGDLLSKTFTPHAPPFTRYCRNLAYKYAEDPELWERVLSMIDEIL